LTTFRLDDKVPEQIEAAGKRPGNVRTAASPDRLEEGPVSRRIHLGGP